jgi:hypothetical protein
MKCKHCKLPIVLEPSAEARAKKSGGVPSDYTKLFEYHADCTLKLREAGVVELMRRTKEK